MGCPWSKSSRGSKLLEVGGIELEMGADLNRYTEPESIWAALMSGNVRVLRASWLVAHGKAGHILARRQDLPEEAFIGVDELKRILGEGNPDGVLPIIAISFCWATPAHPDPDGSQLRTVVKVLEREMKTYAYTSEFGGFKAFNDMGIFWDVNAP
eukprot:6451189-Prymnesium_polylepis.1